jgi:hypothetical protein
MTPLPAALCLAALYLLSEPAGAAAFCDPGIPQNTRSPLGYHLRDGDRCEGTYEQPVAAASVEVRSLVASFGEFDLNQDLALELTWDAPPGSTQEVHLRAFSFKEGIYYRMDTAVPAVRGVYLWPTRLLAALDLGHADLGLIAWIDLPGPGESTRQVYLPLRVAQGTVRAGDGYKVSLVPNRELSAVDVTVSRLDEQGNAITQLHATRELGIGYYPNGEPTDFFTGRIDAEGYYRVEITAILKGGQPIVQKLDIYHPGEDKR